MATERKIGAHVYRCDKLPASEGLALYLRVSKLFRAAPEMMGSLMTGGKDKVSIRAFMVLALSEATDADEVHALLIDLAQICRVGSDPAIVGVKPASLEDVIEVAWFAMEVNFKDFLAAIPPDN